MTDTYAPLVNRSVDDWIAYTKAPIAPLGDHIGTVSVADFLAHVHQLAQHLPDAGYALNLCENRYLFMVAFCAAIVRQQTNLLPPNKNIATQEAMGQRYRDTYILHDGVVCAESIPQFDINSLTLSANTKASSEIAIPDIALDFLSAITFTSGSTGESTPSHKPWRTFVDSTHINGNYMLPSTERLVWLLATVPGQHMWGLETSILLPLMARVCVCDARPLFAKDIRSILTYLPEPRMLVSTPVHLRAMVLSGLDFPPIAMTLCATAPLAKELAVQAETLFRGQLQEVYGCSEVGSMLYRQTSKVDCWTIFNGLSFISSGNNDDDNKYIARGAHLPAEVLLQDRLQMVGERQFRLLGRNEDMIEIAGKRGSLQELNKILLATRGVLDGVVFLPPEDKASVNRLAALVVFDGQTTSHENQEDLKERVMEQFRERLDPVFLPRPLHIVDALPREANGKLPRKKLLALFESLS